ncbi:MAG TPA: FAD-dependent oxidoreductase [Candidatus Acidoferrum sp.]|nr:FAD-dependent oxidoreductase [Candidatus Acidoferrum sp.]
MKTLAALFAIAFTASIFAEVIESDICVYGGTSGGVIAAVQGKKMGKKVVIAEFGKHLGGLTSGGLTYTDIGNKGAVGGLSRDFYRALGKVYGKEEAWTFAPSVAEREYDRLVKEHGIPVHLKQRLAAVNKRGQRITEIAMEDGTVYRAKMFIDASYEGDLMAKAGVSYHFGREANSVYGEALNGIRDKTPQHQFLVDVDPYAKAGDASSGLLPFIQPTSFGNPGDGDRSVQAYNFRLCFTKNTDNWMPIREPANYDEKKFELLGRYFDALKTAGKTVTLRNFMKIDMVTRDKTDINNNGGFSTDFIGMNHGYPEADYATREKIWNDHLDYIKGFITYLKTNPRVPENVRNEMVLWGLTRDEFPDTGGWPHQMYVREARRMVSDYVMSEKNCRYQETINDPVGLAAYNMDSHNCRRVVRNGRVENEGDVQVAPMKPYPISYRSIVPKQGQCENLFVPICLAASHIAYGSIRMEPVFMIMGQSSATAASMAIDENISVQGVNYDKLRARLITDGQILLWTNAASARGGMNPEQAAAAGLRGPRPNLPGIVLDESTAEKKGDWIESHSVAPYVGDAYIHDGNAEKGAMTVTFTPNIPESGEYQLFLISTPNPNRASNVPVIISIAEEIKTVRIDQKASAVASLGKFKLSKGKAAIVTVSNKDTDGYVVVDGLQCLPVK